MADYYEVLELSADCTDLAIKKAFRRLALVWHPDKNPKDAGERFRRMLEALEVLGDADKRKAYDLSRAPPPDPVPSDLPQLDPTFLFNLFQTMQQHPINIPPNSDKQPTQDQNGVPQKPANQNPFPDGMFVPPLDPGVDSFPFPVPGSEAFFGFPFSLNADNAELEKKRRQNREAQARRRLAKAKERQDAEDAAKKARKRKQAKKKKRDQSSSGEETENSEETEGEEAEKKQKRSSGPPNNKNWEPQCCICALVASQLPHSLQCHPVLKIPICTGCLATYKADQGLVIGEDGSEALCTWCADGGELFCCDSCPKAFCVDCISSLGGDVVKRVRAQDKWDCFLCAPPPEFQYLRDTMKQVQKLKTANKKARRKRSKPTAPGATAEVGDGQALNVALFSQLYHSLPLQVEPHVLPTYDYAQPMPTYLHPVYSLEGQFDPHSSRWFMHPSVFRDIARQLRIRSDNVKALHLLKDLLENHEELINSTCAQTPNLDRVLFVVNFVKNLSGTRPSAAAG